MMIFKVLRAAEWRQLQQDGISAGAPVDLADGFVHFSTADTLAGTLEKHFAGESGLVLLACDPAGMGDDLKWEPSRGGLLFPHLYRALKLDDVVWSRPLPLGPGGHDIGELE
ncbi:DUF952 domain-containing protein [Paracoccus sp. SCSIO 75233]|uniref:DUF952 domain-containing protein n=1 Tax=Paracoccus sp. SCSIO 75233 TaxID=3017782 RepID=UPI0022F000B7|nr:DUF952 domain-containing protein [Paracoccus sp. SCSIO 75233]WBU52187.1 DUF952 domain-containing protein [Paracoccus sp. SCSIO 75233]